MYMYMYKRCSFLRECESHSHACTSHSTVVLTSLLRIVKEASLAEIGEDRGQEVREVYSSEQRHFFTRLSLLRQCQPLLLHPTLLWDESWWERERQ